MIAGEQKVRRQQKKKEKINKKYFV